MAQAPAAAPACQPNIPAGTGDCDVCRETKCCAERHTCDADPACANFLKCLRTSCAEPPCFARCGLPPQAYVDRFVCQMSKCNTEVCGGPVDACTLCQSTTCGREFVMCQNVAGCSVVESCSGACKGDAACLKKCREGKSAEVLKAFDAEAACFRSKCAQVCR